MGGLRARCPSSLSCFDYCDLNFPASVYINITRLDRQSRTCADMSGKVNGNDD